MKAIAMPMPRQTAARLQKPTLPKEFIQQVTVFKQF
jgi:hypothetical protein